MARPSSAHEILNVYDVSPTEVDEDLQQLRLRLGVATLFMVSVMLVGVIVACTDNDKENVVITLSARQLNPSIRIVSRINDIDSEGKIRRVGADAVVSPRHIGGLRLASELIRPTVVSFLDVMLRDQDANVRIDEITIPASSPATGKTVGELAIDEISNALLIAVRSPSGEWHYNPGDDHEVLARTILILLGSPEDVTALCEQLGGTVISDPVTTEA